MAFEVLISKEAQIELDIAVCFFKIKALDDQFLSDFNQQLKFLKTSPFLFQKRYREIRILLFAEFNYSIHYFIENDKVKTLRILNQSQDF
jgi:hypothetical protein